MKIIQKNNKIYNLILKISLKKLNKQLSLEHLDHLMNL
jgi:hypothetical protein